MKKVKVITQFREATNFAHINNVGAILEVDDERAEYLRNLKLVEFVIPEPESATFSFQMSEEPTQKRKRNKE